MTSSVGTGKAKKKNLCEGKFKVKSTVIWFGSHWS